VALVAEAAATATATMTGGIGATRVAVKAREVAKAIAGTLIEIRLVVRTSAASGRGFN
jgi:hypothetical protein